MTTTTLYSPIGPLMRIDRAAPFAIYGVRFRSSARAALDLAGKTVSVRIGKIGAARLIEQALAVNTDDPNDPFYHQTLTAEQTTIVPGAGYEYAFVDSDGRVLLSGPCEVVDHTRAAAP